MRPDIIPGYRIERRIGSGGMASVYLAVQESLERLVALKVLSHFDSPEYSRRFLKEGRTIAQLTHTHVITIHDIGVVDGLHYLSMEYLDGGDLRQRIRCGVTPAFALELIANIASALGLAHRRGVVHRDVKPTNILFRNERTPLLTDFGIAKQLGLEQGATLTGTILGSPGYMSPEQAQGKTVDGRSDIYSLGIILYEMLSGKKPFTAECDIKTIIKHLNEPLPRLPAALSAYQELLDRMTAKEVDARFKTSDELLAQLSAIPRDPVGIPGRRSQPTAETERAVASEEPTQVISEAAGDVPRGRRRLAGIAIVAVITIAIILSITLQSNGPLTPIASIAEIKPTRPEIALATDAIAPEANAMFTQGMALRDDSAGAADDIVALK